MINPKMRRRSMEANRTDKRVLRKMIELYVSYRGR